MIYELKCKECQKIIEVKSSIKEPLPKAECCNKPMVNLITYKSEPLVFSMAGTGARSQRIL